MGLNLRTNKQYIICDDFDGKRRCQSAIFTNFDKAKEELLRLAKMRSKNKSENPGWYKDHKVSDYYLVKMSYSRI